MPKRKSNETEEERWQRKIKKYECRIQEKRNKSVRRVIYSSDEEHDIIEDHFESESAIPVEPAGSVIECSVDVHNDANASADNVQAEISADGQNETPLASTSAADTVSTADDIFDPELLQALGECETDTVEWGDNIHENISKHFQPILLNGLKKEQRDDLNKKHLFSKNLPYSKAPTLNPEIAAMLNESCRNRDKRILTKQDQIGRALSALGKAMTVFSKRDSDKSEVMRIFLDVGKLIADAHYAETDTRRSVVIPLVEKSLIDPFKDRKRDKFLFGEKLGDLVKDSRGIRKTGQLIQATSTAVASSSTLNWRGPSSRPRLQRGGQSFSRGGGQRAAHQYRRRAPLAQPPQARRQTLPPPPPPPARRQPAQTARQSTAHPQQ